MARLEFTQDTPRRRGCKGSFPAGTIANVPGGVAADYVKYDGARRLTPKRPRATPKSGRRKDKKSG